jgi:hypothetical protein
MKRALRRRHERVAKARRIDSVVFRATNGFFT